MEKSSGVSQKQEASEIDEVDTSMELEYIEDYCTNTTGLKLFQWRYERTTGAPRALLFIAHGMHEHSKRYEKIAKKICTELNCVVISHDHVGHGKSEGPRVIVDKFDTFVDDIFNHIDRVKETYPELPVYLFGHSMGGLIALVTTCRRPDYFKAVVLSAPAIVVDPEIEPGCFLKSIAKVLTRVCPNMTVIPPFDPSEVTSNEEEAQKYRDDPLNYHGGVKVRLGKVIGDQMTEVQNSMISTIQWPFLVLHGDADKIVYIGGSELLFKNSQSRDKGFKVYPGLKHDLLHETVERAAEVEADVIRWFKDRMPVTTENDSQTVQ